MMEGTAVDLIKIIIRRFTRSGETWEYNMDSVTMYVIYLGYHYLLISHLMIFYNNSYRGRGIIFRCNPSYPAVSHPVSRVNYRRDFVLFELENCELDETEGRQAWAEYT